LATVYGIVKQNGGHIWVYSEVGRGTTFKIYLPAADHKLETTPAKSEALPPKARGETILLVEDDALMRSLTRQMLVENGYTVVEAQDGKSALAQLSAPGVSIDVVLTDVVMQGISGPELALELIRRYPGIKVVYMSGYTGELIAQNGDMHGKAMLDKPFTQAMLLKTIHEALR